MNTESITRRQIVDRVNKLLQQHLGLSAAEVDSLHRDALLADAAGMDSLDHIEFIMALEEEFEIEIPDATAEELRTLDQITEYLVDCLGVAA